MAMGPKKKFDFFNGGRGVVLTEAFAEEEPPESVADPDPFSYGGSGGGEYGRYRSSPMGYVPAGSPRAQPYPGGEYLQPTTSEGPSPSGYCDLGQEGYQSSTGYASSNSPTAQPSNSPSWPAVDEDELRKKNKRKQRCRLCANHGIDMEVKGHKWYCPYREQHNCEKCDITRKQQLYMAEQQKLTREQQQQEHMGLKGAISQLVSSSSSSGPMEVPHLPKPFPRMHELIKETSNIDNDEFLAQINKIVLRRTPH